MPRYVVDVLIEGVIAVEVYADSGQEAEGLALDEAEFQTGMRSVNFKEVQDLYEDGDDEDDEADRDPDY